MARSLRRTLVGWLGSLLACVIAVFGWTLHGRVSRAVLAQADASIESRGQAILAALEWDEKDGWELDLAEDYMRDWGGESWLEVRDRAGSMVQSVGPLPAPLGAGLGFHGSASGRELVLAGPHGATLRIGRSIANERAALRALLAATTGAGLVLCIAALCGGWWLATRTLRPIDRMSHTASGISEHDLSRRIDADSVPSELSELALTLNGAFERLEQAFHRQARFTADASHELRTPLSVIRAQAELALRRLRTPQEYRAALEACLGSAKRMSAIVEGLLALARADAGEQEIAIREMSLDEVVRHAARQAHEAAGAECVALRCDLTPVRVRGDSALLGQVVSNLVENAVRYNRAGGHVDVSLHRRNGTVVLQVDDDGPGIPEQALPHLFERFYRLDKARSRERGGSGLGLAIARWIVEAHGGAIRARPGIHAGTTFEVTLPALGGQAASGEPAAPE